MKLVKSNPILMVTLLLIVFLLNCQSHALTAQGFSSITELIPFSSQKNTGEKPQSKVWTYDGKWWTVFPSGGDTFLWRLDGVTWTRNLKISTNTTVKADCKVADNVCHILLWRKSENPSQLISVEYDPLTLSYQPWHVRPAATYIELDEGTETGTIDIDNQGRMWLASDGLNDIRIRWSDFPYNTWSPPIIIESGVTDDDICAVIALPSQSQMGIFWTNQNSKRFGFRTHGDSDLPHEWSIDEVPSSQSALDIRDGMCDDHLNMAIASDGTLYCAVKTGYDMPGYPTVSLLKRNTTGTWDDLYGVTYNSGTRGIVVLNESAHNLKVFYTSNEEGGDILYKESSTDVIDFGQQEFTLLAGFYNNATSTKNNYDSEIVVLASDNTNIYGALAVDETVVVPTAPVLLVPYDNAAEVDTYPLLSWTAPQSATSYRVQVSTDSAFSIPYLDQDGIEGLFLRVNDLATNTVYYWRVQSINNAGASWSEAWSFKTLSQLPVSPLLIAPMNSGVNISASPLFTWNATPTAHSYSVQVSKMIEFSELLFETTVTDTTWQSPDLSGMSQYHWRVSATNAVGGGQWSDTWSFTTIGNNLVGYWKMDEAAGAVLEDASGLGNNAQIFGYPIWVDGIDGSALQLNGKDQYAEAAHAGALNPSHAITLAAWIRPAMKASQRVVEKGSRGEIGGYELTLLSTGKVSFRFNEATTATYKINSRALYPTDGNTWMHIAATYDGYSAKIYINGELNKSVIFNTFQPIETNDMPLTIGGRSDFNSLFSGTLDELRIYNYALTDDEVASLMNTSLGTFKDVTTANENQALTGGIVIYPNPVEDKMVLGLDDGLIGCNISVSIVDMRGRVLMNSSQYAINNEIHIDLDELNLNAGLYLLFVQSDQHTLITRFFKR